MHKAKLWCCIDEPNSSFSILHVADLPFIPGGSPGIPLPLSLKEKRKWHTRTFVAKRSASRAMMRVGFGRRSWGCAILPDWSDRLHLLRPENLVFRKFQILGNFRNFAMQENPQKFQGSMNVIFRRYRDFEHGEISEISGTFEILEKFRGILQCRNRQKWRNPRFYVQESSSVSRLKCFLNTEFFLILAIWNLGNYACGSHWKLKSSESKVERQRTFEIPPIWDFLILGCWNSHWKFWNSECPQHWITGNICVWISWIRYLRVGISEIQKLYNRQRPGTSNSDQEVLFSNQLSEIWQENDAWSDGDNYQCQLHDDTGNDLKVTRVPSTSNCHEKHCRRHPWWTMNGDWIGSRQRPGNESTFSLIRNRVCHSPQRYDPCDSIMLFGLFVL